MHPNDPRHPRHALQTAARQGVPLVPDMNPATIQHIAQVQGVHPAFVHAAALSSLQSANPEWQSAQGLLAPQSQLAQGLLGQQPAQPQQQGLLAGAAVPSPVAPAPTKKRAASKKVATKPVKRAVVKKSKASVTRGRAK